MWATVGKQASFLIPLLSIGSGPGPYCPCNFPLLAWHDICICLVLFSHLQSTQTTNKSTYIFACILVSHSLSLSFFLLCLLLRLLHCLLCFRVALLFARFEPLNWLSAVFVRMSVGSVQKLIILDVAQTLWWRRRNTIRATATATAKSTYELNSISFSILQITQITVRLWNCKFLSAIIKFHPYISLAESNLIWGARDNLSLIDIGRLGNIFRLLFNSIKKFN